MLSIMQTLKFDVVDFSVLGAESSSAESSGKLKEIALVASTHKLTIFSTHLPR